MSVISSVLTKAPVAEKAAARKAANGNQRAALINRLCEARGTEYRGLKQYRSL